MKRLKSSKMLPLLVIGALLVVWEIIVRVREIPLYVLPAPSKVFMCFGQEILPLLEHAKYTVAEALIGMGIALGIAVVLGILMDAVPVLKTCMYPILVVTQTVPVIVLAPIIIIYLGFGWAPKILITVLMCFFPIVVSFTDGMSQADEGYGNLLKTYGGTRLQLYGMVKIPAAMISLLSGLKVAATYCISGAVVGEWIASQCGLGYYLIRAKNSYMLDKVFACVLMIILLSLLLNGAVKLFHYLFVPSERKNA